MPDHLDPARFLADVAGALRFFSRLRVPRLSAVDDPAAAPDFPRSAYAIPLAGAILALPASVLAAILSQTPLPPLAVATLAVAVSAVVTGALHEDGLADTADGLAGGRDKDHRLAIMKDSRIGTFGALALMLAMLLRVSLIAGFLALDGFSAACAIVASAAVGRTAMVAAWHRLPPARSDGLSRGMGQPEVGAARGALVVGALVSAVALVIGGIGSVVVGWIVAAAATALLALAARRTIGGQTGDVLGAVAVVAEVGFLVGLAAW